MSRIDLRHSFLSKGPTRGFECAMIQQEGRRPKPVAQGAEMTTKRSRDFDNR